MKNLISSCLIAVTFLVCASYSFAIMDGNELLKKCSNYDPGKPSLDGSFCVAYIMGIRHQYVVDRALGKQVEMEAFPQWLCIPDDVQDDQLVESVVTYIKNNPEKLQYGAPVIVNLSLQEVWPCQ